MSEIHFQLIDKKSKQDIAVLLNELAPEYSVELLTDRLTEMFERHYQCVGIYYDRKLVGVCGLWILTKYYSGRHLEPDNVYVKPEFRNLGIGTKLNEWLTAFARQNNCNAIELNCYNDNNQGQTFWEANNFEAIGIHYSKKV